MKQTKQLLVLAVIFIAGSSAYAQKDQFHDSSLEKSKQYHDSFIEDFNSSASRYFQHNSSGKGAEFTYKFGVNSPTEPKTKILSFKMDPEDPAGAGRGPQIVSNYFTHFGTYAARLKLPAVRNIQPNVGAVVGYFTYHRDSVPGLSEIDYEWLLADPETIHIGTWTGLPGNNKRIGRTINLAKGIIYSTGYSERATGIRKPLTGHQNQPETIQAIEGYDGSSKFYTYGFDWYPDRLRWWMINPATADTVVLWDYRGSQVGIPPNHTRYMLNLWHADAWPVKDNPKSIEKPLHPYELEMDWMSYKPLKK